MKRVIKVKDTNGKTTTGMVNVRNILHFNIQRNTHAQVYKNKKAYNRKTLKKVLLFL